MIQSSPGKQTDRNYQQHPDDPSGIIAVVWFLLGAGVHVV